MKLAQRHAWTRAFGARRCIFIAATFPKRCRMRIMATRSYARHDSQDAVERSADRGGRRTHHDRIGSRPSDYQASVGGLLERRRSNKAKKRFTPAHVDSSLPGRSRSITPYFANIFSRASTSIAGSQMSRRSPVRRRSASDATIGGRGPGARCRRRPPQQESHNARESISQTGPDKDGLRRQTGSPNFLYSIQACQPTSRVPRSRRNPRWTRKSMR